MKFLGLSDMIDIPVQVEMILETYVKNSISLRYGFATTTKEG
jgi:hypothetical protein